MAETRVIITAEANQAIQEFNRLRAEATGALNQVGGGAAQLNRITTSAAQTAFALRQVPAQFTDIVVSLQAGQNPLTVLLQQGGQLRDMFGSSSAAARALGGYVIGLVNPYTILAAAVGTVAVAYYQGSKESDAYTKSIVMSGNAAGVYKGQLADMAREIGKGSTTQGAAATALADLVGTGKVAKDNLQAFALTALNAQKSIGIAVGDTAKDFAELGKSPVEATLKLNEKYNYLTASVYEQIRALERKGDVDAAAEVAQKAYSAAMDARSATLKSNLGTLESAWEWVGLKARKAWDGMLDIGREETLSQKIEGVKKQIQGINLEQMSFVGSSKENKAESNVRKQALLDQLAALQKTQQAQDAGNAGKAAANNLEQAKIKWLQDGEKYLSRQQQLESAITKARTEGAAAGKTEQEINTRVAQVTQSYSDIANDSINAQIESIKRRGATEDAVARRSMDLLSMKHDVGLIREEDYIKAVAQLDNAAFEKEKSRLAEELSLTAKKQNSQKDQAALRGQIDQVSVDQTSRAIQAKNDLYALEVRNTRAAADNYANAFDKQQTATQQIREQLTAQQDANAQIGLTKQGIVDLAAARLQDRAALAEQNAEIADGLDFSGRLSEQYRQQAKDLRDLAEAQRAGAAKQEISDKFSPKDLEDFLDPAKAKSFGESLKDAFGGAGDALTKLRASLEDYGIAQQTIERARAAAAVAYAGDSAKLAAANATITKKEVQSRVGAYGDMAGAAKGFFGENTAGYKLLAATEKAFRLYELGLAAESLAKKVLFKETEVAANVALNAVKVTGEASSSAASTALAGTEASAWGVTAVVKALASLPFPANIAAGAATLAAVIAVGASVVGSLGGGGGGGGQTAAEVQKTQGTGTVFGDTSAKSDSIRRSIELLTANSSDMLPINQGMLTALQNIESSMAGLTNLVVRTTGLTDGTNMGIQTGTISSGETGLLGSTVSITKSLANAVPLVGGLVSGIIDKVSSLWGKTTQNIIDSGLQYGGSVRGLQAGQGFDQYASIDTTKSSWFGLSKSTSNRVEVQGLNDELSKQFGLIFTNLDKSLQAASVAMGGSVADVTKVLDSLTLESTKVSLKGLTGTALTDALNSVISKSMDEIAQAAFPQLDKFRTVGEGYAETVMRLAGDYAKLDSILAASSTTFGVTGMASIGAREHLIELAGGIDQLASQTNTFTQNFLSKAEQLAPVQKYVTDQLAAMGLQSLDTRDKFKDYVLGLANSGALATDAGAQQYTALLALADAFAKTHAATVDLTKSEQEITDERTDLQNKLDELTLTQAQLAEKARAAIDGHNLALYDSVQAAEVAQTRRQMEIALMEAQGDKAGALAANRAAELAAMNATLRPLQEQIYAQQDIATAAQETASILSLQAQMYEATGDKAGAASVLEQQHQAALVGLSPALAAATQATWAAQAVQKLIAAATAENNAILTQQAALYAATGDKVAAAAVLEQQHQAALVGLTPALAAATQAAWDAQAAEKARADTLAESNSLLSIQAQIYELTGNKAGAAAVLQQQHIAALVGLTPAVAAATQQLWDLQAAAAKNEALQSFGNALADSMTKATEAAKAFRALNDALLTSDSSALNPEQKYLEAKRQFDTADGDHLQAAEQAFLDASKAWFGGSAGYAADFAAVIAKNSQFAAASDAQAAAIPGIWALIQKQMGITAHADGGVANGWSLVGEKGAELVNFSQPGRVYTASQSREMMGGSSVSMVETNALLRETVALQREVIAELRADKPQRGAGVNAILDKLDTNAEKLDAMKRTLRSSRGKETA